MSNKTITFTYDAEGHPSTLSLRSALRAGLMTATGTGLSASFVYNGDGQRVKQTIGGVTTSFIGNYYEVTGSTVTKYYYAGTQRIAMRQGTTLYYLLTDHLGSTSITTSSTGTKVAELRYKAWGEVRYTSGTTPTKYQFQGQFSNTAEFGLVYMNARWYDSSLGRWAEADSIVPGGAQGPDRYAFVNNNPVRYTDPSGRLACSDAYDFCGQIVFDGNVTVSILTRALYRFGVTLSGTWDLGHANAVYFGVSIVGDKLASSRGKGESSVAAFRAVFKGGVSIAWDTNCDGCRNGTILEQDKRGHWVDTDKACGDNYTSPGCVPGGGYTAGHQITFASMSGDNASPLNLSRMIKNVVHELGHVYYNEIGTPMLGGDFSRDALRPNPCSGCFDWRQHPGADGAELFSDTFIAWTYDAWNSLNVNAAIAANAAMDRLVPKP